MTFRTASGREFHLEDLRWRPALVDLTDIAVALSHTCRFGGHVTHFHSVAAHSVLVSEFVEASLEHLDAARRRQGAALGLLHDASEAYLGDVCRPLKRLAAMDGYRRLEVEVTEAIWQRFDLWGAFQDEALTLAVRVADDRLCRIEQRDLQGVHYPDPHPVIRSLRPRDARALFLERAAALGLE